MKLLSCICIIVNVNFVANWKISNCKNTKTYGNPKTVEVSQPSLVAVVVQKDENLKAIKIFYIDNVNSTEENKPFFESENYENIVTAATKNVGERSIKIGVRKGFHIDYNNTFIKVFYGNSSKHRECLKIYEKKNGTPPSPPWRELFIVITVILVVGIVVLILCIKKDSLRRVLAEVTSKSKIISTEKLNEESLNNKDEKTTKIEQNTSLIHLSPPPNSKTAVIEENKSLINTASGPSSNNTDPKNQTPKKNFQLFNLKLKKKTFLEKRNKQTLNSAKDPNEQSARYIPPRPKNDNLPLIPPEQEDHIHPIDLLLERQETKSNVAKTLTTAERPPSFLRQREPLPPPPMIPTEEEEEQQADEEEEYLAMEAGVVVPNTRLPPTAQTSMAVEEEDLYDDCCDEARSMVPDEECEYEVLPAVPDRCPTRE